MSQLYSLNVFNGAGRCNRAPIFVASEYCHWSQSMEIYLRRLGKEVWRSIEKGPHVPILTPIVTYETQTRLGGGQVPTTRPTNDDIEKI